jgi:hypothetical protein
MCRIRKENLKLNQLLCITQMFYHIGGQKKASDFFWMIFFDQNQNTTCQIKDPIFSPRLPKMGLKSINHL